MNFKLYFFNYGSLWQTDGTPAGTVEILELHTPGGFALGVLNGKLFFSKFNDNTTARTGLWVSDLTTAGTHEIPVNGGSAKGILYQTVAAFPYYNCKLLFEGAGVGEPRGNEPRRGLCQTNGTSAGTTEIRIKNTYGASARSFALLNGKIIFGPGNLYSTDGTAAGTEEIAVHPAPGSRADRYGLFADKLASVCLKN